ncbi:MAG: aspartyl protease family protein [Gemmataceae bacterium]
MTFPLQAGELKLTVVVSLHHQAMVDRLAAGLSLPAPIWTNGVIDTGSSITCIASDVIQRLGTPEVGQTSTRTASGSVPVRLFEVSLSIPPAGNLPGSLLTRSNLIVMELIDPPPDVEVLIGLDILLDCRLLLDGPGRQFTLDF